MSIEDRSEIEKLKADGIPFISPLRTSSKIEEFQLKTTAQGKILTPEARQQLIYDALYLKEKNEKEYQAMSPSLRRRNRSKLTYDYKTLQAHYQVSEATVLRVLASRETRLNQNPTQRSGRPCISKNPLLVSFWDFK